MGHDVKSYLGFQELIIRDNLDKRGVKEKDKGTILIVKMVPRHQLNHVARSRLSLRFLWKRQTDGPTDVTT